MPKIVDCSLFFNENLLFQVRAEELKKIVDHFVVVEATRTHSGARKDIFFNRHSINEEILAKKIVHYIVDDLPCVEIDNLENRWLPEQFHRNSIIRPLSALDLDDNDVILISDVDEIPTSASVEKACDLLRNFQIVVFEQKLKKYFLNNQSKIHYNDWPWLGTVACKFETLKTIMPQGARLGDPIVPRAACVAWGYGRDLYPYEVRVTNAGWHLSSMGGLEAYMQKMHSFAGGGIFGQNSSIRTLPSAKHNWKLYREDFAEEIESFMKQNCPDLCTVNLDLPGILNGMDIPHCVILDPYRFEALFYLDHPLD